MSRPNKILYCFIRPAIYHSKTSNKYLDKQGTFIESSQNIYRGLMTDTTQHHYLTKFAKNLEFSDADINIEMVVNRLKEYDRLTKMDVSFANSMSIDYVIREINNLQNNIVVLYTKIEGVVKVQPIEIQAIFTYTTVDEIGDPLQYKRIKSNGKQVSEQMVYIQAYTVNNLIPQRARSVSGSAVFNWFYYTAKRYGMYCVKIEALDNAMDFWKDKVNFSFVFDPDSNYLNSNTDRIAQHIIHKIDVLNKKKRIKHKGRSFKEDLDTKKSMIELTDKLTNLYKRTDIAEMTRINSKSSSLSFVSADEGSENIVFVHSKKTMENAIDQISGRTRSHSNTSKNKKMSSRKTRSRSRTI
jgi:hypothetical protein